jgi:hypothetical protein
MDFEVWILLLFFVLASAGGQILVSKKELSVNIGRSVFLRKDDLVFVDSKKSECRVEVDQNDPITQRVGRMEPTVRQIGDFTYTHVCTPLPITSGHHKSSLSMSANVSMGLSKICSYI